MKILPYRSFHSRIDFVLERFPILGKLLSSLFGVIEVYLLEFFRRFDNKFDLYGMGILNKYLLKGRWGGRVVPLNYNIDVDCKFLPSQEIMELISRSNIVGVGWCYCRSVQRKYGEPNCDHPLYTCIHVGFGRSLYEIPHKSKNLKKVSKREVEELLHDCDERGLVHQIIYFPSPQFYYVICNCCPCCCVVLKKFLEMGSPHMVKSEFIAKTDLRQCTGCGECVDWCYFGARKVMDGKLEFDSIRCFGCGICISKCPIKVITLNKKEKN
ncbi:MAG: hypothetical protein GF353_29060 [Candidatus Lokiarchaeota archaeon]|nr:hypothetical protein [Candidatus Lokiarchaeota archaeon]